MTEKKIEFYKAQIAKYQKLKENAPDKERVEDIIQMYKEELQKLVPGLATWTEA